MTRDDWMHDLRAVDEVVIDEAADAIEELSAKVENIMGADNGN